MKFKLLDYLRNLIKKQPALAAVAKPEFIKAQLPRPSFTKRMTSSRCDSLRSVLLNLTIEQADIAFAKGWDKNVISRATHTVPA